MIQKKKNAYDYGSTTLLYGNRVRVSDDVAATPSVLPNRHRTVGSHVSAYIPPAPAVGFHRTAEVPPSSKGVAGPTVLWYLLPVMAAGL
jgi:hypothetical protein